MGGPQPACVYLTQLKPPDLIHQSDIDSTNRYEESLSQFTSDVSVIIRSSIPNTTFWASSARPLTDRNDFAIGSSSGTILVAEDQASWSFQHRMPFHRRWSSGRDRPAEVLAVDWYNRDVVMSGCRDGTVRLWDVRSKSLSAGTSSPLEHPSTINHVRKLNANRVVVAGIENRMCVYDLRFLRKSGMDKEFTRPFVTVPGYRNRERNGLAVGFDVLGDKLVAVGTDDERVQVFDAGTGREVEIGTGEALGKRKLRGLARCLRFASGERKGEGAKLLVSAGRGFEEWSW